MKDKAERKEGMAMAITESKVNTGAFYTVIEDPTAHDAVSYFSDSHLEEDSERDLAYEREMKKKVRRLTRRRVFETVISVGLIILVGVFVMLLIFPQMELSEMSRDNSDLKDEISALRKSILDSEEDLNGITDMDSIRAQALALGMQDPNANQVVTIPMPSGDKLETVIIYDENGVSTDAYDHAVTGLQEYYRDNPTQSDIIEP